MKKNEPLPPQLVKLRDDRFRAIQSELEDIWDHWEDRRTVGEPSLDLARLVLSLGSGARLDGEDREACEERARRNNRPFDSQRPFIEFRDLTKASGAQGGFLVQQEISEVVDILRPWSVTARAGMLIDTGLIGDSVIPKITAKSTPAWLSTETSQVTASQPTLAQIALTPKTVAGLVQWTRQLAKQTNAQRFVERELKRTIGTTIDQGAIAGTGASGQPLGLINTPGVQTQSGTTLNAGCATMKRKSAEANVNDEQISFLSTPAVRELLEGREKATGGGNFVWQNDRVADRPARVSTDVPTAVMICGDWSLIYLGIWGQGFVLEINPFDPSGFKAGLIQGRVLVSCDIAVLQPAGFVVASSIT